MYNRLRTLASYNKNIISVFSSLCTGSELPHAVTRKFPHLRGLTVLRLPDGADARRLLRGQLAVSVASADGAGLNATGALFCC